MMKRKGEGIEKGKRRRQVGRSSHKKRKKGEEGIFSKEM
jgi:hypothetical protein